MSQKTAFLNGIDRGIACILSFESHPRTVLWAVQYIFYWGWNKRKRRKKTNKKEKRERRKRARIQGGRMKKAERRRF